VAFGRPQEAVVSVGLALVVGVVLALIALPFYNAAYGVTTGGVAGVVSKALVDEVLLRLFLVTVVVWVGVRELGLTEAKAVGLAIGAAALVQVVMYLPGVLAVGFPTTASAVGFMVVTALVPALALGMLYWRRGFATAVMAHATALGALFLIVGA
jgi:hypothetical protein